MGIVVVIQWLYLREQRRIRRSLVERTTALREAQALGQARERELGTANEVLQRQAAHLELGVQVGQLSGIELSMDEFADRAVRLIRARLDLHDVGLFLLDEERTHAVLQARAGAPSQEGTARGSFDLWSSPGAAEGGRLAITEGSLLGRCVHTGRPYIVSETPVEPKDVLVLAETRSVAVLPMVARGRVIGAIMAQSREPGAFREEDVASLRTMSDQVSVALSHARLSNELEAHVRELETLQGYYMREAWERFLPTREKTLYEYGQPGVPSLEDRSLPEVQRVLADPRLTILDSEAAAARSALVSPIRLREQVYGVLGFHQEEGDQPWTEDQIALVTAISDQMGLILENSRLFEEAQLRAARERRAREVTARMRESLDVEAVLRTAVREMGEALNLHDVTIRLSDEGSSV
jgi:GAF domain-containing protein